MAKQYDIQEIESFVTMQVDKISRTRPPVVKGRQRITLATVSQRVNLVMEVLLDGWSRYQIVQMGAKKWGIAPRTTDKYIARAHKILHILSERERSHLVDMCERRLQRLYHRALKANDLNLARNIIKDLLSMFGLSTPKGAHFSSDMLTSLVEQFMKGIEQAWLSKLEPQQAISFIMKTIVLPNINKGLLPKETTNEFLSEDKEVFGGQQLPGVEE